MALGMRPQSTMRRPTGPSNLATSMFGGLAAQQPMMPMIAPQSASPQPTAAGRIPIGGAPANLSALFAEADKMAKQSQTGDMVNGQFQPSEETLKNYADFQKYNNLYQYGMAANFDIGRALRNASFTGGGGLNPNMGQTPADVARRKQMDLMSLSGQGQADVLKNLGYTAQGQGTGQSAESIAAQKEAEAFLKSLGLGG